MYIFVQQILVYLNEDLNNVYVLYLVRFTFSTKLMQLKIWDPLFAQASLKALGEDWEFCIHHFVLFSCLPY